MAIRIHPTAEVSDQAVIGDGTSIWHHCQVRRANLGRNCILGKGVYVDDDVTIGDNVKIQNYVSVYHGVTLDDGVFVGPHVCFTNDMRPRAINPDGTLKSADDWIVSETHVRVGASLGANSTIRCGVNIGKWAMVGSGSVITRDVPDHALVYGNPARIRGFVCACGERADLEKKDKSRDTAVLKCPACSQKIEIPLQLWETNI